MERNDKKMTQIEPNQDGNSVKKIALVSCLSRLDKRYNGVLV